MSTARPTTVPALAGLIVPTLLPAVRSVAAARYVATCAATMVCATLILGCGTRWHVLPDRPDVKRAGDGSSDASDSVPTRRRSGDQRARDCPAAVRQAVIERVNTARRHAGVRVLADDARLGRLARTRARDMATEGKLSHAGWKRSMRAHGERSARVGENVAYNQPTATAVVAAWMKSRGHRANILQASYRRTGVGCAIDASGGLWWAQVFAD